METKEEMGGIKNGGDDQSGWMRERDMDREKMEGEEGRIKIDQ